MKIYQCIALALALPLTACLDAGALTLVDNGSPQVAIWYTDGTADKDAALDLAATIKLMTGADLALKTSQSFGQPPAGTPAVVVGELAKAMGLAAPPATPSGDGYRIKTQGNHLQLSGETPASTFFATSHLLESFGCRWFIDNDIGTVIPSTNRIEVGALDVAEAPDFISRSLWGPNWSNNANWTKHNRLGGMAINSGHNWPTWFCTTDPVERAKYLTNVLNRIRGKGAMTASISPPDGTKYCPCDRCKALDDPTYIEPSSGRVVVSDRFQEFYNFLGVEAAKVNPQAILCHYAYADYTLPPRHVPGGLDNLCVSIAPIRFCRVHSLGNPACESRQRCAAMTGGWGGVEKMMTWREYNYNLAEVTVPISKIAIWKNDIRWLHEQGCIGLNIECMYMPHLYGPHTWLVARMAWDADLDVDAAMEDFFLKFGGPAGPHLQSYWNRIDAAYVATPVHAGSFHGVHAFWTPALIAACQADLDAALLAAGADATLRKRVEMFQYGLDNAKHHEGWRQAVNRCDFATAQISYDRLIASQNAAYAAGVHRIAEYKNGYVPRFLGILHSNGLARATGAYKVVRQLPDKWMFRYDPANVGESEGWFAARIPADAEGWQRVKTYSATLNEQQIPEQLTWMWYQTTFRAPKTLPAGPLKLWFMEPDGNQIKVWLDGQPITELLTIPSRKPFEVDVTGRLSPDAETTVTVKLNHSSISELMLGGLVRPVMVYGLVSIVTSVRSGPWEDGATWSGGVPPSLGDDVVVGDDHAVTLAGLASRTVEIQKLTLAGQASSLDLAGRILKVAALDVDGTAWREGDYTAEKIGTPQVDDSEGGGRLIVGEGGRTLMILQ